MELKRRSKEEVQEWMKLHTINDRYPFTLEEMKKWKDKKGIYALMYKGFVIYVGQSINLGNRLKAHNAPSALDTIVKKVIKEEGRCNHCKAIAMYGFIKEHREEIQFAILKETDELNKWEEIYINHWKPKYNYRGVDVPYC